MSIDGVGKLSNMSLLIIISGLCFIKTIYSSLIAVFSLIIRLLKMVLLYCLETLDHDQC